MKIPWCVKRILECDACGQIEVWTYLRATPEETEEATAKDHESKCSDGGIVWSVSKPEKKG